MSKSKYLTDNVNPAAIRTHGLHHGKQTLSARRMQGSFSILVNDIELTSSF